MKPAKTTRPGLSSPRLLSRRSQGTRGFIATASSEGATSGLAALSLLGHGNGIRSIPVDRHREMMKWSLLKPSP